MWIKTLAVSDKEIVCVFLIFLYEKAAAYYGCSEVRRCQQLQQPLQRLALLEGYSDGAGAVCIIYII